MAPQHQKRRRLSVEERMEVIKFARTTNAKAASARFNVSISSVYEWCGAERELAQLPASSTRLPVEGQNESTVDNVSKPTSQIRAHPMRLETASEMLSTEGTMNVVNVGQTMVASRGSRRRFLVGYQGEKNGFSYIAARHTVQYLKQHSASENDVTGFPNHVRVLEAIHNRVIDCGLVPTDILLSPSDEVLMARLVSLQLGMIGEVACIENVSVCALPGTSLRHVDCIMSDFQVLSRCEEYILQLERQLDITVHRQIVWDSATACRIVRSEQATNTLVLCSATAAREHSLKILLYRVETTSSMVKYTAIGRRGAAALQLNTEHLGPSIRQCTILLSAAGRLNLLDVVSTFARLSLSIERFTIRNDGDGSARADQGCVISYRGTSDAVVENRLDNELARSTHARVHLGNYYSYSFANLEPKSACQD